MSDNLALGVASYSPLNSWRRCTPLLLRGPLRCPESSSSPSSLTAGDVTHRFTCSENPTRACLGSAMNPVSAAGEMEWDSPIGLSQGRGRGKRSVSPKENPGTIGSKVRIRYWEGTPKPSIAVRGHVNRLERWGKNVAGAVCGRRLCEGRGGRGLYHPGLSDHRTR